MTLPRSHYVQEDTVSVYHCFSRCVRRAYLCGFDAATGRNYSHRKAWIREKLRELSGIYAIEVISYSVLENHYHTVLRTRPDIAGGWSDTEVARRWLVLSPNRYRSKRKPPPGLEEQIAMLAENTDRIEELRKRLSSLSWFMKYVNEYVARAANKEDAVKGRFWESRFKCQRLLDEAAVLACMVYVDLNPIRAGIAGRLEDSDYTSIQERIRQWRKEKEAAGEGMDSWLCPIKADGKEGGILPMREEEYFEVVDRSGRMVRSDKRGCIKEDLVPILERIGARHAGWLDTITKFGSRFGLVAGRQSHMREYACLLGKRWFVGTSAAAAAP